MHLVATNESTTKFPTITFKKKRLTVAVHAHFDLESANSAAAVKKMIEDAVNQLARDGQVKISYSVADV